MQVGRHHRNADRRTIRVPDAIHRSEVADDAAIALDQSGARAIDVSVDSEIVTLEGTVEWNFDRDDAERVVRTIPGVHGVDIRLAVRASALLAQLIRQITKRPQR